MFVNKVGNFSFPWIKVKYIAEAGMGAGGITALAGLILLGGGSGIGALYLPTALMAAGAGEAILASALFGLSLYKRPSASQKLFKRPDYQFVGDLDMVQALAAIYNLETHGCENVNMDIVNLILEANYLSRHYRNTAFIKDGQQICTNSDEIKYLITGLKHLDGEDFDPQPLKAVIHLYSKLHQRFPDSKFFIPIGVTPKNRSHLPHCFLLVIEGSESDSTQARITLVDTYPALYPEFKERIEEIVLEIFNSEDTIYKENMVKQQNDVWSCGWHLLENIEFLMGVDNVQECAETRDLPTRTAEQIKSTYDKKYPPIIAIIKQMLEQNTEADYRAEVIRQCKERDKKKRRN